jgi:hypothetical protein
VGEGVYIMRNLQNIYIEERLNTVSMPRSVLAMTAVWEGKTEAYLVFDNLSRVDAFSHSDARKLGRFRSHAISATAFPQRCVTRFSIRSSPPNPPARAPAWDCPSAMTSFKNTAAKSASKLKTVVTRSLSFASRRMGSEWSVFSNQ